MINQKEYYKKEDYTYKKDIYSLQSLFNYYKETKDDIILSELYRHTHARLFEIVFPKVTSTSITSLIIQDVYRLAKHSLTQHEREQCVYSYLTRLADGCLITYSSKLSKA